MSGAKVTQFFNTESPKLQMRNTRLFRRTHGSIKTFDPDHNIG